MTRDAAALLAAALLGVIPTAAEVRYDTFRSAALGRDVDYAIQLPPSYATGERRYPVLHVLHGLFESPAFWEERGLPRILEELWKSGEVPVYRAVAAHSAMALETVPTAAAGAGRWHLAAFSRAFGEPIDTALWTAADPLAWAARADPRKTPALYFDCGDADRYGLFKGNEELHRRLLARGVAHEFALRPGDHGYEYVRSVLVYSLRFVGGALRGSAKAP